MPSFYPRSAPNGLPLTPPEFVPSYNTSCASMQYSQNPYACQPGSGTQTNGRDYMDRYDQTSSHPTSSQSMVYHHPNRSFNGANSARNYYEAMGAPLLPPMRMGDLAIYNNAGNQRAQEYQSHLELKQHQEEKPVGGVSATLDYDMEVMTDFVTEMASGIVDPSRHSSQSTSLRRWVRSVLTATRLPSATILLALRYLADRLQQLREWNEYKPSGGEQYIMHLLTVALLLGSKFLDDNTFINRSWQEVSGIEIKTLNEMETEWLKAIGYRLHRACEKEDSQGWSTWDKHWKKFEQRASVTQATKTIKLAPLDTTMNYQRAAQPYASSGVSSFTPSAYLPAYTKPDHHMSEYTRPQVATQHTNESKYTPTYTPYDNYLAPRSANDYSPASAPYTGPTTPEYYGQSATWASDTYNRRSMFGNLPALSQGPILPQPQSQSMQQQSLSNFQAYAPTYPCGAWNGHGAHCNCMHCLRQHSSYYMQGMSVAA